MSEFEDFKIRTILLTAIILNLLTTVFAGKSANENGKSKQPINRATHFIKKSKKKSNFQLKKTKKIKALERRRIFMERFYIPSDNTFANKQQPIIKRPIGTKMFKNVNYSPAKKVISSRNENYCHTPKFKTSQNSNVNTPEFYNE